MVRRGKQCGHKRDLIEAGLNEAAAECAGAMGIVLVARWRLMFGFAWRACTDGDLHANDVGGRALHAAVALVYDPERNITRDQVFDISQKSCSVLNSLGPRIQWLHSYVTADKIYCIYLAPNEEMIRAHATQGDSPEQDFRGPIHD